MIKTIENQLNSYSSPQNQKTSIGNYHSNIPKINYTNISNSNFMPHSYLKSIFSSLDVLSDLNSSYDSITNVILKSKIEKFLSAFDSIIEPLNSVSNHLPTFNVSIDEDSVFLEWAFKDFRIGFTISENDEESLWFLTTTRQLEEMTLSGDLKSNEYSEKIKKLILYVLENT